MSPSEKTAGSRKWLEALRAHTAEREKREHIAELYRQRKILKFDPEYKQKKSA